LAKIAEQPNNSAIYRKLPAKTQLPIAFYISNL